MVHTQSRSQFVGREQEIGDLLVALDETRSGHGRAVLIGGEPGIGKTRLANELALRADQSGSLVLWGRAWEDAGAPAYWPWIQALRALVRAVPKDEFVGYLGSAAGDLAQMLPELRDVAPDVPASLVADPESARFQLFDSTASLLRRVSADRPLLIVLDDLHAADAPTILLMRFLATQLDDIRLLLVGTYRDLELTPNHALTHALSEMARDRATTLMMVGGLRSDAVSDYITAATSVRPDGLTVAAVWRETNGNPLFVGEAVRMLETEGRLAEVGQVSNLRLAVPSSVRAVIARRLGHLAEHARVALTCAAVIGPEFGRELLRRIDELDTNETDEALEEAVSSGLLLAVPGTPGRYRFSHDLVRETLYEQIDASRRVRLHRMIGEALETLFAGSLNAHLAELAFHYSAAASLLEATDVEVDTVATRVRAVEYASRAGAQAISSLAYEKARELYAMALAAFDQNPSPNPQHRAELLLALGDADSRTGDVDRARVSFLEAATIARQLNSGELLARAVLGYGGRHQWARAGSDTQIVALLQDALAALPAGADQLRIRLLTRLAGAWRSNPERRDDCDRLTEQAVVLARGIDDRISLGFALAGRFWATWWPDNTDRYELVEEMMTIASEVGDGERIAEAHLMKFISLFELGRIHEARRALAELSDILPRLRQPADLWLDSSSRIELALFDGDFATAERGIGDETASTYHATPGRDDVSANRMHLFLLRREQGRGVEEEDNVRASVREFPWYPMHRAALACMLAEDGRRAEAQRVLSDLAEDHFAAIYPDNEWLLGMCLASQAAAVLEDKASAMELYKQLAPYAGRHAVGHAEGSVGWVDTYLGLLSHTVGDLDKAVSHLDSAVEALDRNGGRPWLVRAQIELARVLRRRGGVGDIERARQLSSAALLSATELGMPLAAEIAARLSDLNNEDDAPVPSSTMDGAIASGRFAREGDFWIVEFGSDSFRLRDSRGMRHLSRLLRSPGIEIHALELVGIGSRTQNAVSSTSRDGLSVGDPSDTGPLLDAEAKAAYRDRLASIDEEISEADRWNDDGRRELLAVEREALIHELAAAVGLGNRDRTSASSSSERARVSATRAIRTAIERLGANSASLGAHLNATIRTGTFCAYMPDPRVPIEWRT